MSSFLTPHEDGTFLLHMSKGVVSKISAEDAEEVGRYKWRAGLYRKENPPKLRVYRRWKCKGKIKRQYLSVFLMKPSPGLLVDHKNRDTLDNRRTNLRVCTHSQNIANRAQFGRREKYKGISKESGRTKWKCYCRKKYIGTFETAEAAALAWDAKAREYFGEFACLNFPIASNCSP